MRSYFVLTWLIISASSCTLASQEIIGNWIPVEHQCYDIKKGTPMQECEMPFKLLSFIGDTVYLDGKKSLYAINGDQLTFAIDQKINRFTVSLSEDILMLETQDLTPATTSFYYFKRITSEKDLEVFK